MKGVLAGASLADILFSAVLTRALRLIRAMMETRELNSTITVIVPAIFRPKASNASMRTLDVSYVDDCNL